MMIEGTMSRLRMSCWYERKPAAADLGGRSCRYSVRVSTVSVVSETFSLLGCDKTNSVVFFYVVFSMGTNHQARVIPKHEGCALRTATRRPYLK